MRSKYLEKQSVDSHSHVRQLIKSILLQGFGFISFCWEKGRGKKVIGWAFLLSLLSNQMKFALTSRWCKWQRCPHMTILDIQLSSCAPSLGKLPPSSGKKHPDTSLHAQLLRGSNNLRLLMAASSRSPPVVLQSSGFSVFWAFYL